MDIDVQGRPYFGPENAPVTIVEFVDYECSFCGRHARETLPELRHEYEGTMKYVIFNFPISRIHPFAHQAGQAAECAHDQGEFREYHDILFQHQQALDRESLKLYAENMGLDTTDFSNCLDSDAKGQLILDDIQAAQSYVVGATPTFFINGKILVRALPFSSFQTLIDEALSR